MEKEKISNKELEDLLVLILLKLKKDFKNELFDLVNESNKLTLGVQDLHIVDNENLNEEIIYYVLFTFSSVFPESEISKHCLGEVLVKEFRIGNNKEIFDSYVLQYMNRRKLYYGMFLRLKEGDFSIVSRFFNSVFLTDDKFISNDCDDLPLMLNDIRVTNFVSTTFLESGKNLQQKLNNYKNSILNTYNIDESLIN